MEEEKEEENFCFRLLGKNEKGKREKKEVKEDVFVHMKTASNQLFALADYRSVLSKT